LIYILWFKETENSENNGENTQQTYSANAAATNPTENSSTHTITALVIVWLLLFSVVLVAAALAEYVCCVFPPLFSEFSVSLNHKI
jgi:hypothetical protein